MYVTLQAGITHTFLSHSDYIMNNIPWPSLKCGDSKECQHRLWNIVIIQRVVCPFSVLDFSFVNISSWIINVLTSKQNRFGILKLLQSLFCQGTLYHLFSMPRMNI